jgi:DNA repair photolyase
MKIYIPSGKAAEYSPLALNYFRGCTHGCTYCYATKMIKRYDKNFSPGTITHNKNFSEFENSCKKFQGCNKQILLQFMSDSYCGYGHDITTKILEILLKYKFKVNILSKGGFRILKDLGLFKEFGKDIIIGCSLTFDNNFDSFRFEPDAAEPGERIETLKILQNNNIRTWASFEPVIFPEQTYTLLKKIHSNVEFAKFGKINYDSFLEKKVNWNTFLKSIIERCNNYKLPFYIKESLQPFLCNIPFYLDNISPELYYI